MKLETRKIGQLFKPVGTFFQRFHTILFFLLVSGGLFGAILVLLSIINLSGTTATSTDEALSDTFDEATIDRIDKLGQRNASQPGARPSPFVEP